jgi:hypothetical protein
MDCLCGTVNLDGLGQVGDASLESEQERRHGMSGPEWRVATALFTAGEVTTSICIFEQACSCLLTGKHMASVWSQDRVRVATDSALYISIVSLYSICISCL